ncbi:glycerophosphodiester phosphodiesterase [Opitutaceae bacterium EW11]|nr:glycerophosphodiester phosphodiesterase [Opitutaceae bacterium EW11]
MNNLWPRLFCAAIAAAVIGCGDFPGLAVRGASAPGEAPKENRVQQLHRELIQADHPRRFVVAHRGDWRDFPENSVAAFQSCIEMGIEMVELDVQRTKDGELIVMHDTTVDRTTTGHGSVSELTLAEIRALHLRNGYSHETPFAVPTLREVLVATKGRILLNLDKSYPFFRQTVALLEETGTLESALMKGDRPVQQVLAENGDIFGKVAYMPVIDFREADAARIAEDWLTQARPCAMEIVYQEWTPAVAALFAECNARHVRIWVNLLWPELAGGMSDDLALSDPDSIYGVLLGRSVSMFQTDRPKVLQDYLRHPGNKARVGPR